VRRLAIISWVFEETQLPKEGLNDNALPCINSIGRRTLGKANDHHATAMES